MEEYENSVIIGKYNENTEIGTLIHFIIIRSVKNNSVNEYHRVKLSITKIDYCSKLKNGLYSRGNSFIEIVNKDEIEKITHFSINEYPINIKPIYSDNKGNYYDYEM